MSPPKVAIIGAAPAGSTLARLLMRASIPVTIFEGESSMSIGEQGGTLDLHGSTGLKALREAGLHEDVDTHDLWLHFHHGVERGFDLLIGADGAWSKVRPVLTDVEPYFIGLGGFDLFVHDTEKNNPELHKFVSRGSLFVCSDCKGLVAQQKGDGTIIVYASGKREKDWKETCGYDLHNASEVKKAIREEFKNGAEPLVKLTQVADDSDFTARSLYILPPGRPWKHRPKVTLIGDAAHLVTPHAGEGVNVAMEDPPKLADAIIRSTNSEDIINALDKEVSMFEDEMMTRATKVQKHSLANTKDMYFNPAAPHAVVHNLVRRAMAQQLGWVIEIVLSLWFIRNVRQFFNWWYRVDKEQRRKVDPGKY